MSRMALYGRLLQSRDDYRRLMERAEAAGRPEVAHYAETLLDYGNRIAHGLAPDLPEAALPMIEEREMIMTVWARSLHTLSPDLGELCVARFGESVATVPRVAESVFAWLEGLVPKGMSSREIGDAIEVITMRRLMGWSLYRKLASTIFWVAVNAVREVCSAMAGRKSRE